MPDSTATATITTGSAATATLDEVSMDNNFGFTRGNDHDRQITVQQVDSTQPSGFSPVDLTGASCLLTMRRSATDPMPALQIVGVLAADPTTGVVDFLFLSAATAKLEAGLYLYDVDVTLASGKHYSVDGGTLELQTCITQPVERESVHQYSASITLTSVGSYPGPAQVTIGFAPQALYVSAPAGGPGCYVSVDGTHDSLHILAGAMPVPVPCPATSLWLREDGAGALIAQVAAQTSS